MINLVFITDDKYVFPTKIAVKSIIENKNKNTKYNINIICIEVSKNNCNLLKSLENLDNGKVVINLVNRDNIYKDINMPAYVTPAALFKFQLADILTDLDKCLYIDGDTVIEKDLSEFYNTNIEDAYAGVIPDYAMMYFQNAHNRIGHKNYFNSGVMLLNLKKMRDDKISEKLITLKRKEIETNSVVFMDQDALNVGFEEKVKYLPLIYNYFVVYSLDEVNIALPSSIKNNLKEYEKNVVIFHIAGGLKPWHTINTEKYFALFWKYADNDDILKMSDIIIQKEKSHLINSINALENKNIALNNEIEILKNKTLILENEIYTLKEKKKYPKWFCNLACCFIIKKKNRHHFRIKHCKNNKKIHENKALKLMVNLVCCFIPKQKNRQHFREKYLKKLQYCPYCNSYNNFLSIRPITREHVLCPNCGSLERHRFLYFLYRKYNLFNPKQKIKILHFAPEKCLYNIFSNNEMIEYTCVDLCPENYSFAKNIKKEDGMHLSFKDKTFDIILHNHVLEHVPNDKDFIKENLRVLKDNGIIIASFPYDKHNLSYFNDNITTPEERTKYFHQCDHVRLYGTDFYDKLKDSSYNIEVITNKDIGLSKKDIKNMSIKSHEDESDDTGFIVIKKLLPPYLLIDEESDCLYTNNKYLDKQIKKFKGTGITNEKREKNIIISLTSFPERMHDVKYTLYSLLNQTLKPNKIILWLADSQFPNKEKDLPKDVLKLKGNGLSIEWCEDLKSYKKLIPALQKYSEAVIVTVDDDIYYRENWLETLYNEYLQNPDMIHCHRAHLIKIDEDSGDIDINYGNWQYCISNVEPSFKNFATGCGGILYPPNSLYKDVVNTKLFEKLSPTADDIWFWAMAVLNGTKINVVKNNQKYMIYTNIERELCRNNDFILGKINNSQNKNTEYMNNIFKHYFDELIDKLIDFNKNITGERLNPEFYKNDIYNYILYLKHQFAYEYAAKFINKNSNVLEFGCGSGYGSKYLSNFCKNIEALDVSIGCISENRKNIKEKNLKFYYYDGVNLDYKDNTFDVIISFQVIEHVKDVELYLKNMIRVLKPSGTLIITTPSRTYRLSEDQKPWNRFHLREYNSKQLRDDLDKVISNYSLLGITANDEILNIEFNRVKSSRFTLYEKIKDIDENFIKSIDYLTKYSTNNFFTTDENIDNSLDLLVVYKKGGHKKNDCLKNNFNSVEYWENRYKTNGNSGAGSYNRLAEFKAEIINDFVKKNNIETIIEFGCGDGNQLSLFNFKNYIGFDVSETVLNLCKNKFKDDNTKIFKHTTEFKNEKADLVLSLDVIYHLIEDEVFELYMDNIFKASNKFVIIYSSNKNQEWCTHVRHRKFTDWIDKNQKQWKLYKFIPNKYPFDKDDQANTSFADFYIFKKK